jgi:hypothetical protein
VGWSDSTHISILPPDDWLRLTREAGLQVHRAFGDGLWDVPYVRWVPAPVQRAVFGWPALLQVLTVGAWMPVKLGETIMEVVFTLGAVLHVPSRVFFVRAGFCVESKRVTRRRPGVF